MQTQKLPPRSNDSKLKRPALGRSTVLAAGLTALAFNLLAAEQEPRVIDAGPPPSDAVVLFDGKDLSQWQTPKGGEAKWVVSDGVLTVKPGGGNIMTKEQFGDVQVHVEWATPAEAKGEGQNRGNSGVYLQGRYEIQVLDSYNSKTYFNGQAGAFYGHNAPLVNACRKPGEWQTYDIIFHPPKAAADGKVEAGSFTVLQNGVLVQDHIPVAGEATTAATFKGVTPKGPLLLQDHGHPVRFRNIWARPL
ncbi:MAG: 3-keto-disaccharide hydrolase [Limisphaerales bacterium]